VQCRVQIPVLCSDKVIIGKVKYLFLSSIREAIRKEKKKVWNTCPDPSQPGRGMGERIFSSMQILNLETTLGTAHPHLVNFRNTQIYK
jgi:hypothetical protein